MRREEGCRQFMMPRGTRCMSKMIGGAYQRPYKHIMPMSVSGRDRLADTIGVRGSGADLLLSSVSPSESRMIDGTGFGVKTPSNNLLKKLDNLNVGKKIRKNVNINL